MRVSLGAIAADGRQIRGEHFYNCINAERLRTAGEQPIRLELFCRVEQVCERISSLLKRAPATDGWLDERPFPLLSVVTRVRSVPRPRLFFAFALGHGKQQLL